MTDLRQAAMLALKALEATSSYDIPPTSQVRSSITALRTALEQQAEPPSEWHLIKNILDEYGLQAISFVAEWKAGQRQWVGLTDEDCKRMSAGDKLVAMWAEAKLKEKNSD